MSSVVTVQDIARNVGLSASSVSAVLSGQHIKRRISPATAARVRTAAKKLRYVPNVTARSLRAQVSGTFSADYRMATVLYGNGTTRRELLYVYEEARCHKR